MEYQPSNDELQDAVALLSSVLHRLEARGIELTVIEGHVWEMATDILHGIKICHETVGSYTDLSNDNT